MSYLALVVAAIGFFMSGFYYSRYKTLMRAKGFIGKGDLSYFTVLQIITNDLP